MVMLLRAHATSRAGELQIIADQIHERDHNVEVGSANLWSLDESLQPVGVDRLIGSSALSVPWPGNQDEGVGTTDRHGECLLIQSGKGLRPFGKVRCISPLLDRRHGGEVLEAGVVPLEESADVAGGTVAVLAHDQVGLTGMLAFFVVEVVAVHEDHHVGVLLKRP